MNQIIGSGNKVSYDISMQSLMNNDYLKMSSTDYTYLRRELMISKNIEVYVKLLTDILTKVIVTSIEKRTGIVVPYYTINITGELDEKEEFLKVSFVIPDNITIELITLILEEEFKDEQPDPSITRRILRFS